MNKIILYVKNVGIALIRVPASLLWLYRYHPGDSWLKNALVVLDCLGNTLAGGDPNETISSRSAKAQAYEQAQTPPRWGFGCRLCSFLAVFQEDHCEKALERNVGRDAVIPDDPSV